MSGTRIDLRFAALRDEGRAGLVAFVTAGDPDFDLSLEIVKGLPGAGADVIELGNVVAGRAPGRTSEDQITVADLTGVAVQDIEISKAVLAGLD